MLPTSMSRGAFLGTIAQGLYDTAVQYGPRDVYAVIHGMRTGQMPDVPPQVAQQVQQEQPEMYARAIASFLAYSLGSAVTSRGGDVPGFIVSYLSNRLFQQVVDLYTTQINALGAVLPARQ